MGKTTRITQFGLVRDKNGQPNNKDVVVCEAKNGTLAITPPDSVPSHLQRYRTEGYVHEWAAKATCPDGDESAFSGTQVTRCLNLVAPKKKASEQEIERLIKDVSFWLSDPEKKIIDGPPAPAAPKREPTPPAHLKITTPVPEGSCVKLNNLIDEAHRNDQAPTDPDLIPVPYNWELSVEENLNQMWGEDPDLHQP